MNLGFNFLQERGIRGSRAGGKAVPSDCRVQAAKLRPNQSNGPTRKEEAVDCRGHNPFEHDCWIIIIVGGRIDHRGSTLKNTRLG